MTTRAARGPSPNTAWVACLYKSQPLQDSTASLSADKERRTGRYSAAVLVGGFLKRRVLVPDPLKRVGPESDRGSYPPCVPAYVGERALQGCPICAATP